MRRTAMLHVYRTTALGTIAELVVTERRALVGASELLNQELARIDSVANRFRPDSELSRLNAAAGRDVHVSADLFDAVDVALAMAAASDGLVDPTVGHAMDDIGYDRDFAQIRDGVMGELPAARPIPGWRCVVADAGRGTLALPIGVALDLGATAKALASDRAASTISAQLGVGALVSLGGDASVAGPAPAGGFAVGIADTCTSPDPTEAIALASGGLASSGTSVRRWQLGSHQVHHILDPATGLPAPACWRTVSTAAASCVQANTASTAAVVLGADAVGWLEEQGLPARLVHVDGTIVSTSGWPSPVPTPLPATAALCTS